jgi:hypothetical protein
MNRLEVLLKSATFRLLDFRAISVIVQYRLEAARTATIIPIPFLRNDDRTAAFTEIRGVKLAKEGPMSEAYTADLETYESSGGIGVTINFGLDGRFDNNTSAIALRRAQAIKSKLIFLRGMEDG